MGTCPYKTSVCGTLPTSHVPTVITYSIMSYLLKCATFWPKVCTLLLYLALVRGESEIWEKDMSKDVYIEASREGYKAVDLKCKKEGMEVVINTDEDFEGVIYTRGSYMDRPAECFLDPSSGLSHTLTIPLDKCNTKVDDNGFHTNTVILQHDDWLIFPGDDAFTLQCKYDQEVTVSSRVGLADPDPSAKELPKHKKSTVEGKEEVTFTPDDIRPRKKKNKKKKKKDEL